MSCNAWLIISLANLRWQNGLDTKVEKSRKQMKERKNRAKKIRGVKKVIEGFSHLIKPVVINRFQLCT